MTINELLNTVCKRKNVTKAEIATKLGITRQNFSNKLKRNTFSPDELAQIADALDMEIALIDKNAVIRNGEIYTL